MSIPENLLLDFMRQHVIVCHYQMITRSTIPLVVGGIFIGGLIALVGLSIRKSMTLVNLLACHKHLQRLYLQLLVCIPLLG